jgi:hypothetical protein
MSDPMPTVRWILGMPVRPKTAAELLEDADRQLIEDARDMSADLTEYRVAHVAGTITDLASALERRMEP